MDKKIIRTAVILAGGKGERLRPFTEKLPKALLAVKNKPMLQWQIETLKSFGIGKVILAVHSRYGYKNIRNFVNDKKFPGVEVKYSIENTSLGTGGALRKILEGKLLDNEDDFLVLNCDIFTNSNLLKMVSFHFRKNALVTMLAVPYRSRFGIIDINKNNCIIGYKSNPKLPYWVNGGVYIMNSGVKKLLPNKGNQEDGLFKKIPSKKLVAFRDCNFWRAIDSIKDKRELEQSLVIRDIF